MAEEMMQSTVEIYGKSRTQYKVFLGLSRNAYSFREKKVAPFVIAVSQKTWKPGERVHYLSDGKRRAKDYLFWDEQQARAKFIELHKAMYAVFTPLM